MILNIPISLVDPRGFRTQFATKIVDLDHSDEFVVFLAKKRCSAQIASVVEAGGKGPHRMVFNDAPVDQFFDFWRPVRSQGLLDRRNRIGILSALTEEPA